MDRRQFFKSLTIGAAAAIVVPKLLIPKEKPKFITYTNPDGVKMTLLHNPEFDDPQVYKMTNCWTPIRKSCWIRKEEWDFEKKFMEERERIWWQHGIN